MRDPWPWYALGLLILAGLLYLAHHYDEHRLPKAREALDKPAHDGRHPVDRDQTRDAAMRSLLLSDKRADRHGVYPIRPQVVDIEARRALGYTRTRESRLDNVVPFVKPDDPPRTAA